MYLEIETNLSFEKVKAVLNRIIINEDNESFFESIIEKSERYIGKINENSVLFIMNKFHSECEDMYNKMDNCIGVDERDINNNRIFKFINKDSGLQFNFAVEYLQLEKKIMESYKEVICKYSPEYSKFFS